METNREKIEKYEKEGWIFLGEVECCDKVPFPTGENDFPYFLYTKYDNGKYWYSICTFGIQNVYWHDHFYFDKRYSINTILCAYISADRHYGRIDDRVIGRRAEGFKIRLVGYDSWIEVNEDYLNLRITIDELEQTFRSDRVKKLNDKYSEELGHVYTPII